MIYHVITNVKGLGFSLQINLLVQKYIYTNKSSIYSKIRNTDKNKIRHN